MTRPRDERDLARLCEALEAQPYAEPGPARLEFERRRFMAQLERGSAPGALPETRAATAWAAATWATAAAIVIAIIAGVVLWRAGEPGSVTLVGAWYLEPGDAMAQGARVRVPAKASAKVVLPDGTSLWFERGSEFELCDEMGDRVELHSGRLLAKVAPRIAPRSFSVVTQEATVVVHGTVFSVSSSPDGAVIRLHEGRIRVFIDGTGIDVEPGHELEVGARGLERMGPFGAAERLADIAFAQDDLDSLEPAFAALGEDEPIVSPPGKIDGPEAPRGGTGEGSRDDRDEAGASGAQRRMADRGLGDPSQEERRRLDREGAGERERNERELADGSTELMDAVARIREHYRRREWARVVELSQGAVIQSRPDVLYFRGKSLEKLGLLEQAAVTYEALARLAPERGDRSRYLAAKARFHLGDYTGSFALASQAAQGGGPVAEQARYLALRAAFAAGQHEQVTALATGYLEDFPQGAYREDALYSLALSLFYLEDFGGSEQSFRLYIERYPHGRYAEKVRRALSVD